ncbi:SDR family oxidoreductase [Oerskovia enterophila]|uniref:SDR family oxidoreductase n=1 Tax=Oerskovia enterophila TaxID=43678 RepID=UPI0038097175
MSTIAIIGAHGKVGRIAARLLSADGHDVIGVVRNPAHTDDIVADGATPVVIDLEQSVTDELAASVRGVDSIIFTAGSGGGSGPGRKDTMDRAGAIKAMEAAAHVGVDRFIQVSYLGADEPPEGGTHPDMLAYQKAKHAADEALRASTLRWTIVRPGALNDAPLTRRVTIAPSVKDGTTSRANTGALLALLATTDRATGHVLNVIDGDTPLEDATPR